MELLKPHANSLLMKTLSIDDIMVTLINLIIDIKEIDIVKATEKIKLIFKYETIEEMVDQDDWDEFVSQNDMEAFYYMDMDIEDVFTEELVKIYIDTSPYLDRILRPVISSIDKSKDIFVTDLHMTDYNNTITILEINNG